MKVYDKTIPEEMELVGGHIYRLDDPYSTCNGKLYIFDVSDNSLVNLETGNAYLRGRGTDGDTFIDVTDQYRLTKVNQ